MNVHDVAVAVKDGKAILVTWKAGAVAAVAVTIAVYVAVAIIGDETIPVSRKADAAAAVAVAVAVAQQ